MSEVISKKLPLISVIINCYNGEKYLRQAIDSVLSQSYKNFEIIFWDNQSTDASAEIVQSFKDSRIKYFFAPNHTVLYEARNQAVEKISGDFLSFIDCDDIWRKEKLERQLLLFEDEDVGFVCSNYDIISENGEILKKNHFNFIPKGSVLYSLSRNYCVGMLTLMIRANVLKEKNILFDSQYSIIGDYDMVLRLSMVAKMNSTTDSLASYRLHPLMDSSNVCKTLSEKEMFIKKNKNRLSSYCATAFNNIYHNYILDRIKYYVKSKNIPGIIKVINQINFRTIEVLFYNLFYTKKVFNILKKDNFEN